MRLWFSPSSEVPIYRQLVTQVVLAIHAGDLRPGDKLPSTRELARRFALHPNTISAGYRQLEREGWTEQRRGSGVYVRGKPAPTSRLQVLDAHIAGFFRAARELGVPAIEVRARVAEWLAAPPPDHFLLIDPEPELRRILLAELRPLTRFPIAESSVEGCVDHLAGAVPLCRPSKTALVRAALPAGVELVTLPIRSATGWLTPWMPLPQGHLVGVASRWPEFVATARTMLIAAGLPPESLIFRDARRRDWHAGLEHATAILSDAATACATQFPKRAHAIVFQLLADTTKEELTRYTGPA